MKVRALTDADRSALVEVWDRNHAGAILVTKDRVQNAMTLEGFAAEEDGRLMGALTYVIENGELEVVTLDSLVDDRGSGTALLAAAIDKARAADVRRAWLITSNDNIRAIRFYQRRGWDLVTLHRGAIDRARKIKPDIPLIGDYDIPLHHEIEFEFSLR